MKEFCSTEMCNHSDYIGVYKKSGLQSLTNKIYLSQSFFYKIIHANIY